MDGRFGVTLTTKNIQRIQLRKDAFGYSPSHPDLCLASLSLSECVNTSVRDLMWKVAGFDLLVLSECAFFSTNALIAWMSLNRRFTEKH